MPRTPRRTGPIRRAGSVPPMRPVVAVSATAPSGGAPVVRPPRPPRVAVIGGASPPPWALDAAYEVGVLLAVEGVTVVCGGLEGVMEATCRGAVSAGGTTIGILPHYELEAANPFVTIPIATGIGYSRNIAVVLNGDAVLAIDGSHGTLSEIGYALLFHGTVVGLRSWAIEGVVPVQSPKDAVEALRPLWTRRARVDLGPLHHPPKGRTPR